MKDTSAVDPGPGPIRDDLWNMAEEGGLDEFLSTIPDGDEVSALGGGEKSNKGGGLANWDVLDEALSADIATSSAPALVAAGKKKSPPSSDLRPDTPMGHTANGDANGFGGDSPRHRDRDRRSGGSKNASKSTGSGGSGSGYVGSADGNAENAALDGLANLSAALATVRAQQIGAGNTSVGEVPDLSAADDAPAMLIRLQNMLEAVSERVELGSLVQMFIPKLDATSGAVTLITHRALARVSTVHDEKFWKYHQVSESFFFNLSPNSSEGLLGLPGRCFLYGRSEWTPSVCCYRPMEYPRLQCAIECQVNSTVVVPLLLAPASSERETMPFAVMEIVMDRQTMLPGTLFETVSACMAKHGFHTCDNGSLGSPTTMRRVVADAVDALCESNSQALVQMCRALGTPYAQCWMPKSDGEWLITSGAPFCIGDVMTLPYRQISEQIALRRGQGPVGQACEKGTMIWVDDVQNGSQVEWPLHHATALLGLHGMCACKVMLANKDGSKTEAVIELYLPGNLTTAEQQQASVDAFWTHLQNGSTFTMASSGPGVDALGSSAVNVQPIPTDINHLDPFSGSIPDLDAVAPGIVAPAAGAKAGEVAPPWGITLEMLQMHFSKHLKEAAKDLGVGSTTLKRICRHFGISRWPRRSLKSKQGRLQNALKTLAADGALPPGQFGIHASGTYMGQEGRYGGHDMDSPGGSMHDGSSFGGSIHGGSSYGGSLHAGVHFTPGGAATFGGSAHAGAMFPGGAMGGPGGSTRNGSNLTGLKRDSGAANGLRGFDQPGGSKARGVSWHGGDGAMRSMARNGYMNGAAPVDPINIPNATTNPLRGNSFHGGMPGNFGPNSPTNFGPNSPTNNAFNNGPGGLHRQGSFGNQVGSPGAAGGGPNEFAVNWNSFESAGTTLMTSADGATENGGRGAENGGRSHGGSAAGSLLRQSSSAQASQGGSMAEDFLAVNDNGAGLNGIGAAGLTVKVSVNTGDNVRFKLLPGMSYVDVQSRLKESIGGQVGDLRLRYQDEVDEWCALNGDSDLAECIHVCQSRGIVRMQAAR